MKLSELMQGKTPSASFEGFSTADDMVLAIDFTGTLSSPSDYDDYIVAQVGITEQSGSLSAQTQDSQYLRTGSVSIKTGTSRSFNITGDRYTGDSFQDAILAHAIKYGTGQEVIKSYVYFNMLTGKGEKGKVSIAVADDLSGAAGDNAGFSVTLSSTVKPEEYTYTPPTPDPPAGG
ncbi:MAG: hypothetical protein GX222_08915 [Ruminococcaceae bacterium]|nr:hypothetical protein [Oscillospiraceae bacterium]